jgi:hypothetical protein
MKTYDVPKANPRFVAGQQIIGQRYWVQCEDFRCIAIVDYEGKWKIFHSGQQLTSDVLSFWQ